MPVQIVSASYVPIREEDVEAGRLDPILLKQDINSMKSNIDKELSHAKTFNSNFSVRLQSLEELEVLVRERLQYQTL